MAAKKKSIQKSAKTRYVSLPEPVVPRPSPGRIVNFVLGEDATQAPVVRPAQVVVVYPDGKVSLQVAVNGFHDDDLVSSLERSRASSYVFRDMVAEDQTGAEVRTWHWPVRT